MVLIAPSILSAEFAKLAENIAIVENHADLLHIDIMDGHYVPNLTIGAGVVASIRKYSNLFFETHLMISNPDILLNDFIKAGSNRIVIHPNTCSHFHKTISQIKKAGVQVGIAVNPSENFDICNLKYLGNLIDSITIMSVNPGFPAQEFIEFSVLKIKELKAELTKLNLNNICIELDGGINEHTAREVIQAGADILVAGNAIYNMPNPVLAIEKLKNLS